LRCSLPAAAPPARWAWRRRCLQTLPAAPVPSLRAVAVCPARRRLGEWSPTSPRPLSYAGGDLPLSRSGLGGLTSRASLPVPAAVTPR
jgi:hypothetical protein